MKTNKPINRGCIRLLAAAICWWLLFCGVGQTEESEFKDTSGTEFIFSFLLNNTGVGTLNLFIASHQDTQGVVEIPGLGFSSPFTVEAGQVTTVTVPTSAQHLPSTQISNLGIRVAADAPVHLYGLNLQRATSDAFLGLPLHALGTDYLVMSHFGLIGSQFSVIGTEDNTEVTIIPAASVGNRPAGEPFTVNLNRLETFRLRTNADLTGTSISASAPVAVMGGEECANVPRGVRWCDHIVDMMPPLTAWGRSFLTYPLATRLRGDMFRVLASRDGTEVYIDGELAETLNTGGYFDRIMTEPARIEANAPVLLAQYSVGQAYDNVPSDPFMMLVPPSEQFLDQYTFTTPVSGFNNFVNVVIPTPAVDTLTLNGEFADSELFSPIGSSGYSGAQIPLQPGSHAITAAQPFGIYVYGFASYDSYGYPGGMSMEVINPIHGDYRNVQVVSTIATGGVALEPDSFLRPPDRIEQFSDRLEIEWQFDQFNIGQIEDLDFELILQDPLPGEQRLVSHSLEILYEDLHGNQHRRSLVEQLVAVLPSIYRLDLALDKTVYTVGEPAAIEPGITNLSEFAGLVGLELEVRDASGNIVAVLPAMDEIAVAAGERVEPAPASFNTAGLYAGDYEVHARLREESGEASLTAVADFRVDVPKEAGITASVATDRDSYEVFQSVMVAGRLGNTAPNAQIEGHTVSLAVYEPDGAELWRTESPLQTLPAGGNQELVWTIPLEDAVFGDYQVELTAYDAAGAVRSMDETGFRVLSTAETGAGLAGYITAVPDPVYHTENLNLAANVANNGNEALHGLPVTLALVDPARQQEVASWSETVNLDRDDDHNFSFDWSASAAAGTTLVAVLRANFGGEAKTLASTTVRVEDKFVSTPSTDGRGRLLVLMDAATSKECGRVESLNLKLESPQPFDTGEVVRVELFDRSGQLLDVESAMPGDPQPTDYNSGNGANLVIKEISGRVVAVEINQLEDGDQAQAPYRLVATLYQTGLTHSFDSGPLRTGCENLPEPGSSFGKFTLTEVEVHSEGTDSPQRYFLEELLRSHGWSFTVVTDDRAFARELRQGGYSGYLLLSSRVKLDNQVSRELREAIFAGRGLVMAGHGDHRNHHLLEVTGVEAVGVHPQAGGIVSVPAGVLGVSDLVFAREESPLALRLDGAIALSDYLVDRGRTRDRTAVAYQEYGKGESVTAGFDLLSQAYAAGVESGFAALLLDALEHVHPEPVMKRSGMTVPVRWQIDNRGGAASIRLNLDVAGGQIVDPGHGLRKDPQSLYFDLDIPAGGTTGAGFWWQLPEDPLSAVVSGLIELRDGGWYEEYGITSHAFTVEPAPSFEDIRAELSGVIALHRDYARALRKLEQAEAAYGKNRPEQAVFRLLKAADILADMEEDRADTIRESLAWLVDRIAGEI